ncbi:MAG: rhomboid family intramembrane serine protease [Nakamurella sp.]
MTIGKDGVPAVITTNGSAPATKRPAILLPGRAKPSVITIAALGVVLTLVQAINSLMNYRLNTAGIRPRSLTGLWGVADAPLLHSSWEHLGTNIVPFLIFGFLVLIAGLRQFISVTILVWLISGIGVWLTAASNTVTVGASTLVFGWLAFLLLRGVFSRRFAQLALGVALFVIWGGVFWGLLPGRSGISWQGHLFGAIAGALAAFLVAKADRPRRSIPAA